MSHAEDLVAKTLSLVGDRAEAEALAHVGRSSLTRFANSFIHQNVSEDEAVVSLKVAAGGKVASSTATATDDDALENLVDATIALAKDQPVDNEWPGFGGPVDIPDVDHWDDGTGADDPADRADAVREFVDAGEGMLAAGYCQTEAIHKAYGNTSGRQAFGRYTTAVMDGIHRTPTSAGSGHAAGSALGDIDAFAVGSLAADRARRSENPFDTKPGEYEVVLSPECIATIAIFLSFYGFNAKFAEEGTSFARVGEMQFDSAVDMWDDATDPRALYAAFDDEGTPKQRKDLILGGVTTSLVHNRRTAAKEGVESTGHAFFGSDSDGPFASNIFIRGGTSPVDDLIAGVERGIYVSTFNYCRVLDPKTLVVTGLTRNGTFMIENGRVTDPVTNLRFTQSFCGALGPGNVLGIADNARFADSEFGATIVHAPSMRLGRFNFTGGAAG